MPPDRASVAALLGEKVAVRLATVEASHVHMIAVLSGIREDGIELSEIGDFGPGPVLFCPWVSLLRVRKRPPWLAPPREEGAAGEAHELSRVTVDEPGDPSPAVPTAVGSPRGAPYGHDLRRVVPIAQKATVGGVTVALISLELYGEDFGVLSYRLSIGDDDLGHTHRFSGFPEPVLTIRTQHGVELDLRQGSGGGGDRESHGQFEVWGLPETGTLEVRVERVPEYEWGPETGEDPLFTREGPWVFRFGL